MFGLLGFPSISLHYQRTLRSGREEGPGVTKLHDRPGNTEKHQAPSVYPLIKDARGKCLQESLILARYSQGWNLGGTGRL